MSDQWHPPEGYGKKIPVGEFLFPYGSEDWMRSFFEQQSEYNRPENKDNRLKALNTGLPKEHLEELRLVRGIGLLRARVRGLLKNAEDADTPLSLHRLSELNKDSDNLNGFELDLGRKVATALLQNDKEFIAALGKIAQLLQDPAHHTVTAILGTSSAGDKQGLPARILKCHALLKNEWFQMGEPFQMVTKAALREMVFPKSPTEAEKKDFTSLLKHLGLSKLPERKAGKKS